MNNLNTIDTTWSWWQGSPLKRSSHEAKSFSFGHAQVVGQESDHAAGLHIGQFAKKNQLLDHQGGGVTSSQRQDLGEQVPNRYK